uniref:TRAF-type domain-containing protein n=1 Tax=Strigamia maritima TaxID=126957 RepID=T1IZU7_STRMM
MCKKHFPSRTGRYISFIRTLLFSVVRIGLCYTISCRSFFSLDSYEMDSIAVNCFNCGTENNILKKQLCGDICCRCCGQFVFKQFIEKIGEDSHSEFCSYCKCTVEVDKIKTHSDVCDMYPINCNFCNGKFIRRTMNIHVQECACNLHRCKYYPIGCQFKGSQSDVESHENGTCNFHVGLMMNLLLNLQIEQSSNASMIACSFKELVSIKDDNNRRKSSTTFQCQHGVNLQPNQFCIKIKEEQDKLKETVKRQEMEINACKQQISDLEIKLNRLLAQNTHMEQNDVQEAKKMQKSLELQAEMLIQQPADQFKLQQDHENTLIATSMITNQQSIDYKAVDVDKKWLIENFDWTKNQTEFKDTQMELNFNVSSIPFNWKFKKFAQIQANAKSGKQITIYSESFYSHECGYRMRLRLDPNGGDCNTQ